ncbi:MAG: PIG-L family deacetylase [Ilumatobacteraceae bacterium]|nr:PIG-L family deacetylase [Ilumatobacteraceae bacterium]
MATLVTFHAHPDDEVLGTGGVIARAADEGHHVVLVVATGGEHGEVPDDLGEQSLAERRRDELDASAAVLGIDEVVWLGYHDSGMTGWDGNNNDASFHRADVEAAAARLLDVVDRVDADVLTIYDWHGGYGHPDHIKVHDVGLAAARQRPALRVLEATFNRDAMAEMMASAAEDGVVVNDDGERMDPHGPADDGNPMGTPEAGLTLAVDVRRWVGHKRQALRCHRSQVTDTSMLLEMADEAFEVAFGTEWFIEHDAEPPLRQGWIFGDRPLSD